MKKPEIIRKQEKDFIELMEEDNSPFIKPEKMAKFIGMDKDALRESIANGTCPFGVGGRGNEGYGSRFAKIPKLVAWNWFAKMQ